MEKSGNLKEYMIDRCFDSCVQSFKYDDLNGN
jgi:hypothetical protein